MLALLRNRSLLTLCLAAFSAYMGAGMVSTVRVLYVHSRGGSLGIISAMAIAFLLSNFVAQYPWGWLADRIGRKPVILIGSVGLALTTSLYLVVSDPVFFVLIRVVEGLFAASILPAARAAIADLFPDNQRGRAYGVFSAFFNMGFMFGPAVGGLIAGASYPLVFAIATCIRLVSAVVVWRGFPAVQPRQDRTQAESGGIRGLFTAPLVAAYIISFGDYLWIGFDTTLAPLWMRHHLGATITMIGVAYSVWAVPNTLLVPFGGRLADRFPRWRLILIAGVAQLPMFVLYGASRTIYPVLAGFAVQAAFYAVVSPAVDAHLAASSPTAHRGRIQSTFSLFGVAGALVGATAFVPLYAIDYRLPLYGLGIGYAASILVGSAMIALSHSRLGDRTVEQTIYPEEPAATALQ